MSQETEIRLRTAYDGVLEAREAVTDELKRFNAIVVDGRREGMSWQAIARATGRPGRKPLSRARIMQIVGEHAHGIA